MFDFSSVNHNPSHKVDHLSFSSQLKKNKNIILKKKLFWLVLEFLGITWSFRKYVIVHQKESLEQECLIFLKKISNNAVWQDILHTQASQKMSNKQLLKNKKIIASVSCIWNYIQEMVSSEKNIHVHRIYWIKTVYKNWDISVGKKQK